ncbi:MULTISPECIES: DivIVA domain-containing protein [Micromonospora]|uniref:Cell wall synthesis protein Wag31 n=1 Tax=Micromonospora solifontis TaxID=2487138 RepID=A0ABX9WP83_9ACTN|nr:MULTISPECIES: DivIVA domain-containing protein [Micromonospora]NES16113.1 DivIVA domain-containing protein [Micromonospora sp. PPF5-17B]NES34899.1 DivIVA domain-containing protein [Micromonospora solifontis]NES57617.1 DivIVA domain-containing protein [Micromonospora sp. PPF5-6]RNM01465.1 DivIVA domain-containing protein [Micromonospora solifontis]
MASQGQRFRRKALRRGYKVDEVDAFLDRVEATLAGQPVGAPVASQEVHDVVFRVRFNGYDEWQVDLHLDRVERQLAELEERGGPAGGRGGDPRMADRMGPPMRDDRGLSPVPQPPMPPRQMPAQAGPPADRYGNRYDEPTGAFAAGGYEGRRVNYEPPRGPGGPGPMGPGGPGAMGPGGPGGPGPMGHGGPPSRGLPPGPAGYGQDDRPAGYGQDDRPGGYGPDERFDGFEAGRRGRTDMTAEIRMPERDLRDLRRGPAGPPPLPQQGFGGGPDQGYGPGPDQGYGPGPGMPGPPPMAGPPMVGPPMAGPPGSDLYRVDQIRRSFQVRRFGSGYDPDQVDRFFETLLGGMQGRNPMPVNPNDLDTLRFGLVPGGYFEAEVDAALKDVQDILLGR